jgi:hypothetical protein
MVITFCRVDEFVGRDPDPFIMMYGLFEVENLSIASLKWYTLLLYLCLSAVAQRNEVMINHSVPRSFGTWVLDFFYLTFLAPFQGMYILGTVGSTIITKLTSRFML